MKKIILISIAILILSSCGLKEKEIIENIPPVINDVKNTEIEKLYLDNEEIEEIKINDIREKTEYGEDSQWINRMYYENNENIDLLIIYMNDLKYQWVLEKNEKEYAKIIIMVAMDFIKENIKLKEYEKTLLFPRLLRIIWNNFEILWESDKAILAYKEAVLKNKDDYKSYIDLGNIYKKNQEEEKANEAFKNAANIIKDKKIIEEINEVFKIYDENFWGYTDLWIIYKLLWENQKSEEAFAKAKNIIENFSILNEYERNKLQSDIIKLSK